MRNPEPDIFGVVKYTLSLVLLFLVAGLSPAVSWAAHSDVAPILIPMSALLPDEGKTMPLNDARSLEWWKNSLPLNTPVISTAEHLPGRYVAVSSSTEMEAASGQRLLPAVGWIEQVLAPVYRWVRQVRGLSDSKNKQNTDKFSARKKNKLNRAIGNALDHYQGTVLSIKLLMLNSATYRIKILADSGEVKTLDYSEEQGRFIQMDKEEQHANTVN